MTVKAFIVCLCALAVAEAARSSYNSPSRGGFSPRRNVDERGVLGADCEYDEHCFVDNAYCYMQMHCRCKKNYEPNQSQDSCIARIGADCRSRFDCSSLENSECRENQCACQDGFIPHQEKACLRLSERLGDHCETNEQCKSLGSNAKCINKQCSCDPYEHIADGKCYPNKALRQPCENNNECYIGDGFKGMLQCRNGVCQCREGYHETPERTCAGGNGAMSTQASLFVFVIMSILTTVPYIRRFINN